MRVAVLVPAPDYPEPWDWTFDVEAEVLEKAGCTVDPIAWTDVGDVLAYDLVLPLVAWGYHLDYRRWLALLDRAEAEHWPMINPPALLRWNGSAWSTVALSFLELRHAPELEPGGPCRVIGRQAAALVLLGEQIEMRVDFPIEVVVHAPAQHPGAHARDPRQQDVAHAP